MATYLNLDQTRDFHENGYVIVQNFFNKEETVLQKINLVLFQ